MPIMKCSDVAETDEYIFQFYLHCIIENINYGVVFTKKTHYMWIRKAKTYFESNINKVFWLWQVELI